jgi:hypothetical protein
MGRAITGIRHTRRFNAAGPEPVFVIQAHSGRARTRSSQKSRPGRLAGGLLSFPKPHSAAGKNGRLHRRREKNQKISARKKSGHLNDLTRSPRPIPVLISELSRRAMLLVAIPAIYRAALRGLERYLAFLGAVRALRFVHLSGATEAPASLSVSVSHIIHSLF